MQLSAQTLDRANMEAAEHVLLTGAGFTHNFGAPLATDIWSLVLAHPNFREFPLIRSLLLTDFDYESAYHSVMSGDKYSAPEKDAMRSAVASAYEYVDEAVRSWIFRADAPYPVNIYGLWRFLDRFAGNRARPGFFFSLNQDLFIERHCASDGPVRWLPGLERAARITVDPRGTLANSDRIVLPTQPPPMAESIRGQSLLYVKLHGSSNWQASDGTQRMVIGRGKAQQISQEPLLAAYRDLFENVLSSGTKRLLITGYGFRDEHVNAAISKAVGQGRLQVFILSPQPPESLKALLATVPHGTTIWEGLRAYFPHTLLELFPPNQEETPAWRLLSRIYFQGE